MARGKRLIFDNASYHIMVRGNQKQLTFIEEEDFLKYLEVLRWYKKRFHFKLYGYCLMPNHVHLIMEVKNGRDLRKIMQGLNQAYTTWFNNKYNKVGHLWQGRYKSMVIQRNEYMLSCIEYVELNPVRANYTQTPSGYLWSSWRGRLNHGEEGLLDILKMT